MKLKCHFFEKSLCRSCSLIELDITQQLVLKENSLKNELNCPILPSISSPSEGFRDKVKLAVGGKLDNPLFGLVLEDLSVQDLTDCPVQSTWINESIPLVKIFIQKAKLVPYDIKTQKGELKYIIIFRSPTTSESYIRFVLRSKESSDRILKNLKELDRFKVISLNLQPENAAIIEGKEEIYLTSDEFIKHRYNEQIFYLSPQSFVQTNTLIAEKLFATAAIWAEETKAQDAIDLFCGAGPFALHIKAKNIEVSGFEISPMAIKSAIKTNHEFNLNIPFEVRDLLGGATLPSAQLVVVNPPRRGLAQSLYTLRELNPEYLIYSSCEVKTLKKDLIELSSTYEIKKAQLFDMFPNTPHFESLVLLKKR